MKTTYNETRVTFQDGDKVRISNEDDFLKKQKEAEDEGKSGVTLKASQTCTFTNVSTDDPLGDFAELVPDKERQADVLNRQLDLIQQSYINRLMIGKDFTEQEGALDLSLAIQNLGVRKVAPRKDAASLIGEMDPDKLAAILLALPQDKLDVLFANLQK